MTTRERADGEIKRLHAALVGALKTMDVIAYQTSLQSNMSHENWKHVFGLAWEGRTKARESLGDTPPAHTCGCVPCRCEDPERCQGCGAKFCDRHMAERTTRAV